MEETKVTQKDMYLELAELAEGAKRDDLVDFCKTKITQLENKALKAKEKAGEKKVNGDELRDLVQKTLTKDFQTADAITIAIGNEEVTKGKVVNRLTSLVKNDIAEKSDVKTEDGRTVKAYRLK